jgi:hypothetical protein
MRCTFPSKTARASLHGFLRSLDDDDDVSPEWKDEIRRRVQEMKDGTAIMIPQDEVMANVGASLAKIRDERSNKAS